MYSRGVYFTELSNFFAVKFLNFKASNPLNPSIPRLITRTHAQSNSLFPVDATRLKNRGEEDGK